ncbi:50S ribosomal protein L10 [Candidatus Parcubacteria bacterium]|nr:50S ribosomal protein L10 [Candidatus Parcubacteria bacterium]
MPKTKEEKKEALKILKDKISQQKAIVFVDFTGLGVKQMTELRTMAKKENCELKVAKKTLIQLALKDSDAETAETARKLEGELAVVFGYGDEISPFRISQNFAKQNKELKILGGMFEKKFIAKEEALQLAELPSREELLAKLLSTMKAPISNFVCTLRGNVSSIVSVLNAIKESK